MKSYLAAAALGLPLLAFAPGAWAQAPLASEWTEDDPDVTLRDVPRYILRAARRAAGRNPIESVSLDKQAEYESYKFTVDRYDRKAMTVTVRYDGTIEEVSTEIAMKDVPRAVQVALARQVPDFELNFIAKSVRPGKGIYYMFEGMALNGSSPIMVEIDAKGTEVSVARDPTAGLPEAGTPRP